LRRLSCLWSAKGSVWQGVSQGPEDPILGLTLAYQKDTFPQKVNLGVGAYRTDEGKPYVLECVRKAEELISGRMDHEYAPIAGLPSFVNVSRQLLFGNSNKSRAAKESVSSVQAISGTGALRVGADFLHRFFPGDKLIYVPEPTWGNHIPLFQDAGLTVKKYTYYDPKTYGLDLKGMLKDLSALPEGAVVLLHACAHNPTGVDPTLPEWEQVLSIVRQKSLVPFVDCAYQGFASGDPEKDAAFVRMVDESDIPSFLVTQSFAKNFGLYGERVGTLHVGCADGEEAKRVLSQLKILIRPMYSNPPVHGARIVAAVLSDPELTALWSKEVKEMAERIIKMRHLLVKHLAEKGSKRDWAHLVKQIGMFAYTGLTKEQCERMINEFHVYLTSNGRISIAGVTSQNANYVANAIHEVTK